MLQAKWKTGQDGSDLSYCGSDLKMTEEHGYKIEQDTYMKKVKPIAFHKRRSLTNTATAAEKDVSQLRALLGCCTEHFNSQWLCLQGHCADDG